MSDRRPASYSWKKPWAFTSLYRMRNTLTEREVYRKLKVLERHSSFKKPYRQRSPHIIGELLYSGRGISPASGGAFPGPVPIIDPCPDMGCLGHILSCLDGGCDEPTCICGQPPYTISIISDPSGKAFVSGGQVCMEGQGKGSGAGGIVEALVQDSRGRASMTTWTLDGSCDCCIAFTVTADQSVVDPGGVATFTVNPPCPGATCEVTSNSGCTLGCSISDSGHSVVVVVGNSDCGTFFVTVTSPSNEECSEESAISGGVKINNDGQGGEWAYDQSSSDLGEQGCVACNCGGSITYPSGYCDLGEYRYGGFGGATPCTGTVTSQCKGEGGGPCIACGGDDGNNICGWTSQNCSGGTDCEYWGWWRCTWECVC